MKIAVISDIHGNLTALKAVLKDCRDLAIEKIWCLGDIIGYGANPWECWSLVQSIIEPNHLIKGNHEDALENPEHLKDFTKNAQAGVNYARRQLELPENVSYQEQVKQGILSTLPLMLRLTESGVALVHGDYLNPADWSYVHDEAEAEAQMNALPESVNFLGHTHVPFVFQSGGRGLIDRLPDRFELNPDCKFLINPGSVGQPRDSDCRSCYALLEIEGNQKFFTLRRVFYDIDATATAIRQAGLPNYLAERLYRGE